MVKRSFIDFEQVIIRKINSNKWYCFMFSLKKTQNQKMIWYQSLQTSSISCKLEIHSFNNLIRVCTLYYYKMQFACHDQWYIEVVNITIFHNNCNRRINAIKLQKRIKWTTRNLSTCCWSSVDFLLPPRTWRLDCHSCEDLESVNRWL